MNFYKSTVLVVLLVMNSFFVHGQNLLVGFSDPDEVITLTSGNFSYDTVFILNNGELNLSGSVNFTVRNLISVIGTGRLNVENSGFIAKNIFYMADSAEANLTGTVGLSCSIFLTGHSVLNIDSAIVNIPMTYKGQFSWAAAENAGINLSNSKCYLGAGALGGNFVDSSFFHQHKTDYISDILPMTMGIGGNSSLLVDSCSGGMEYVISQGSNVDINATDFIVVWYTFEQGDTVDYSYPPANSSLSGASNITGDYYFADSISGVSGVDFTVHISNSDYIFWGIISKKLSSVTVNNSTLIASGFYFTDTSSSLAKGFFNSQYYEGFTAPFTDRLFQVNNSTVMAWNFYTDDTSRLVIDSSKFGEYVGFGNSVVKVLNSSCDGTGGYFGGTGLSQTYVYNSQITRTNGTQQIINFQQYARAWFYRSTITGSMVVNDNAEMYFANCLHDNEPVVNANGYFAEAWIDSITRAFVDTIVLITGKVYGINGQFNTSNINRYRIEYSLPDTSNMILIKDTSATSFNLFNQTLAEWNTHDLLPGKYLIWLTIYVDGNPAVSCSRGIYLDKTSYTRDNNHTGKVLIYPNPTGKLLMIKGDNIQAVYIYERNGRKVLETNGRATIDLGKLPGGVYFIKVKTARGIFGEKLVLRK